MSARKAPPLRKVAGQLHHGAVAGQLHHGKVAGELHHVAAAESIVPLTPDRWRDFTQLFGANGACGGCWCMNWRFGAREFAAHKGDGNRRAMQQRVRRGVPPGLLAYHDALPVGWISIAPRVEFPRLAGSRVLKPLDELAVWSVTCLYLAKRARRQGLATRLLQAAAAFAFEHGAPAVEGYPVVPKQDAMPDVFAWTGLESSFRKAGWRRAGAWSPTRPIYQIGRAHV